jgi:hypothetical protein
VLRLIVTDEIFIPIPKVKNTQAQVTVNGDDVTSKVIESEWSKQLLNLGVGSFSMKLSNAHGRISDLYKKGQEVVFICDNSTKTRVQFKGRIDYPNEILLKEGQFLQLIGRHKAWFLNERKVCHRATGEDCSDILKDIMAKEATELTSNNVAASTGVTTDVEWEYKPFPECVAELMKKSNYDAYVDNDLDMHFVQENTIINDDEYIADNINYRGTAEFGKDDYYERTRVTVRGQDDAGLPIIYTAISGIDDDEDQEEREDEGIREIFHTEASLNTMDKVEEFAKALLSDSTNRTAQARWKSWGLETLEPAENFWISIPRQKIYALYKAVQIKHKFGMKVGGWRTEVQTEQDIQTTDKLINLSLLKPQVQTAVSNVNKLKYSYNIPFDDGTYTDTNTRTTETNGVLKLSNESLDDGEWTSTTKVANKNVRRLELKLIAKDIGSSQFWYSLNNGVTYTEISPDTLYTAVQVGRNIKLKAKLVKTYFNPSPEIASLAFLFDYE